MTPSTPTKFASSPGKQTALAIGCTVVGAILAYGFRQFDGSGLTNSLAGFLLGVFLLVLGVAAFAAVNTQTITIDPRLRRIVVEDVGRFSTAKRIIAFGDIVDTGIGYLGRRSDGVEFYYINLTLRDGKDYALFAPGRFYRGCTDRSVMEARRQQLSQWLGGGTGS